MTPEERVAGILTVEHWGNGGYSLGWHVPTDRVPEIIAAAIRAAVVEALRAPLPSPLSAEQLTEIREFWERPGRHAIPTDTTQEHVHALLRHIVFLEGVLRDLATDHPGRLDNWRAGHATGWKAGAEAMKQRCVDAAYNAFLSSNPDTSEIVEAVDWVEIPEPPRGD